MSYSADIGGAITKSSPKEFVAVTPAATIGIRGSAYAGKVEEAALTVVLESGKGIDVYNAGGSVAVTVPGMGTQTAGFDMPPVAPRLFTVSELSVIVDGLSLDVTDGGPGSILGPNSVIINKSRIKDSVNIAIGENNTANMGSVVIQGSKVDGVVVNEADIEDTVNVSSGSDNEANTGTIVIK